jgi:hypothetical protein
MLAPRSIRVVRLRVGNAWKPANGIPNEVSSGRSFFSRSLFAENGRRRRFANTRPRLFWRNCFEARNPLRRVARTGGIGKGAMLASLFGVPSLPAKTDEDLDFERQLIHVRSRGRRNCGWFGFALNTCWMLTQPLGEPFVESRLHCELVGQMPVRQARSEIRGRPPCGRRGAIGENSSTRSHNGSGSRAAAIAAHATSPKRIRFEKFCYRLLGTK